MPPETATLEQTKAIVRRSQRQHFAVQKASEAKLRDLYRQSLKKVTAKVATLTVVPQRLEILLGDLEKEMRRLSVKSTALIDKTKKVSINKGIRGSVESMAVHAPGLPKQALVRLTPKSYSRVFTGAVRAASVPIEGISLSGRIWDINRTSLDAINRHIARAMTTGRDLNTVSQEIRRFLLIPDADMRKKKWREFFKANPPGKGVYRSASKNVERVLRTETNRAFRLGSAQYAKDKAWVAGVKWMLSPGHPESDVCDEIANADLYGLGAGIYPPEAIPDSGHPNCFSDDTEILTYTGFKLIQDIDNGELILSMNSKTRKLEYVSWMKKIEYEYRGLMVHLLSRGYDSLVTPNHRIPVITLPRNKRKKIILEDATIAINRKCLKIPRIGTWGGMKSNTRAIWWARFWGWYIAEGSVIRRMDGAYKGNCYQLTISQSKVNQKNRNRIGKILQKLDIEYSGSKDGFWIWGNVARMVYKSMHERSHNKCVPSWIKNGDKKTIMAFLDEFIRGDGSIRERDCFGYKSTERTYYTSSKKLVDDLCELLIKAGLGCRVFLHVPKGSKVNIRNKIYATNYDVWKVSESDNKNVRFDGKSAKTELEQYDGIVRCLQLKKNHVLCFRRNGTVGWSGNCICYTVMVPKPAESPFPEAIKTPSIR